MKAKRHRQGRSPLPAAPGPGGLGPARASLIPRTLAALVVVGAGLLAALTWSGRVNPCGGTLAMIVYTIMGCLVLARVSQFHPFSRFGPANTTTLIRAGLVCLLAAASPDPPPGTAGAFLLCAIAAMALVFDGIDGWVARRTGLVSRFGARFDMEVDALFVLVLAGLALGHGKAGPWVLLIGLLRYGFLLAGTVVRPLRADLPESLRRKAICVVQITILTVMLLPFVTAPISTALAASALALLSWSFALDTIWLLQRAARMSVPVEPAR